MLFTFRKEYKPLIVSGKKTQTVRIWKTCWLREGQVVKSPGLGKLRITEISQLKLSDLTQEDARLDGFATKAQMLEALKKIYSLKKTEGTSCFRVRFEYLGRAAPEPRARSKSRSRPGAPESRPAVRQGRAVRRKRPKQGSGTTSPKRKRQEPAKPAGQKRLFPPF